MKKINKSLLALMHDTAGETALISSSLYLFEKNYYSKEEIIQKIRTSLRRINSDLDDYYKKATNDSEKIQ